MYDYPSSGGDKIESSRRWREELRLVRSVRDATGMGVDADIERTVVAMRLLGFATTMSCAGHLDRRTTGPYVMFDSPAAQILAREGRRQSNEADKQRTFRSSQQVAQREADALRQLIEEFNADRAALVRGSALELRPVGPSALRLCFVHADFDAIRDQASYRRLIEERQREMALFTTRLVALLESLARTS